MALKKLHYAESELVEMLKKQDTKAFNYLYDNYSDALYGAVLKMVRNEDVAQDLAQEIFVKIWKNVQQYEVGKGRLFTWMLSIARNSTIDYLRIKRLEIQDLDDSVHTIENDQKPEEDWQVSDLQQVVGRLKPEQQQLIQMVYWGGYTHEETAKELAMPLGTVKTRIRSALQDLRKIFGQ